MGQCIRMVGLSVRQFLSTTQVIKTLPPSLWRHQHLFISSSRSSSDRAGGGDNAPTLPNFDYALIRSVKPWQTWLQQEMRSNQAREMMLVVVKKAVFMIMIKKNIMMMMIICSEGG